MAIQLFDTQGYRETTMEDIANGVGLTAGAIYHHYRDKQAILDAGVQLAGTQMLERAQRLVADETAPTRLLGALIEDLVDAIFDDRALASVSRHLRALASDDVRLAVARTDRLLLAEWLHPYVVLHPGVSEAVALTMVQGAFGAAWSVTHTRSELEPSRLKDLLVRALRCLLLDESATQGRRGRTSDRAALRSV